MVEVRLTFPDGFSVKELWEESRALELEGENIDPYSGSDEFFYVEILK